VGGQRAAGLGHGVAQQRVAAGEKVVDVPAKLAARARLLGAGSSRKTDTTDAVSVASVAMHNPKLMAVREENHTVVLRLLSDRRDDVVAQRTQTITASAPSRSRARRRSQATLDKEGFGISCPDPSSDSR
jgi:hypothetical protein